MKSERSVISCPVCKESNFTTIFTKDGLDFVSCHACTLVYINPQPTDDEIKAIYSEEYYRPWGLDLNHTTVEEMKRANFEDKLSVAEKFSSTGKILDIGCASGFFLDVAAKKKWGVYGVEISSYAADIAAQKFGKERIFNGPLEEAGFNDNFFDLIFMSDLVEHVKDLSSFFNELFRITKPGGVVAIITPNIESFSFKVFRKRWPNLKMEHLYYFSPSTVEKLLEDYRFKPLMTRSTSKTLNLRYIERHFGAYPVPLVTPFLKIITKILPESIGNKSLKVPSGELFVIARKAS